MGRVLEFPKEDSLLKLQLDMEKHIRQKQYHEKAIRLISIRIGEKLGLEIDS